MDDSEMFLEATRMALCAAGFEVDCVNDLAQLSEHRRIPADLVLMDVEMPEAFGDDIAMTLRHAHQISAPIYLLSSLSDDELADRVAWAKIDGFISKNVGLVAIVERVQSILSSGKEP
jgi:DNA-binding NarL/FixJ family response regulator